MNQLTTISDEADQLLYVNLPDGTLVTVNLAYLAGTQRWMMNLTYKDVVINGIGVCVHPNLLRQFREQIPFGFSCTATNGIDPIASDDFTNLRCAFFLLSESDIAEIEKVVFGK